MSIGQLSRWVFLLCLWAIPLWGYARGPVISDWGPFYSRVTDVHGDTRSKVLGPLLEKALSSRHEQFMAVRPLYSSVQNKEGTQKVQDFAWPLATMRQDGSRRTLISLPVYYDNVDITDPAARTRLWIFPTWFSGRTSSGNDYYAFFPFYGNLPEFLGRDESRFVLFPLYLQSRQKNIESVNWLWPIYHRTTGGGHDRFRIFPFYGYYQLREETRKSFVLWPFWTQGWVKEPGDPGTQWMLFPLYGQMTSETETVRYFLPPFFRFHQSDTKDADTRSHGFWPLVQFSRGEVEKAYVFPFYGYKKIGHLENRFVLWPIFSHRVLDRPNERVSRTYALPFWYAHTHTSKTEKDPSMEEPTKVYRKLWPLFSWQREGDASRFRAPALWPLKNTRGIEQNWAPWWSLIVWDRQGEEHQTELLWGVWRSRSIGDDFQYRSLFPLIQWERNLQQEEDTFSWAILKGLLGYEKKPTQRSYRFLYFLKWRVNNQDNTTP